MNAIPAAGYKNKSGVQLIPLYTIHLFVSKKSKCNWTWQFIKNLHNKSNQRHSLKMTSLSAVN